MFPLYALKSKVTGNLIGFEIWDDSYLINGGIRNGIELKEIISEYSRDTVWVTQNEAFAIYVMYIKEEVYSTIYPLVPKELIGNLELVELVELKEKDTKNE